MINLQPPTPNPPERTRFWHVERPSGNLEAVVAASAQIIDSGGLVLRTNAGRVTVAYAPGQWVTVTEGEDSLPPSDVAHHRRGW